MEMGAMTNVLLLILFALLGSSTTNGDKQANNPVRQWNNGTSKNSANSYVMSVQYSHGNRFPHMAAKRAAQNSVAWSSNSTTQMRISTARLDVPNVKVVPPSTATKPLTGTNMETSPAPKVIAKADVSPPHKTENPVPVANVQISSTSKKTNPVTVNTKSTMYQVQQPALQEPSFQKTITSTVTYPNSFISAQIAAASLTTSSPDTYVKPAALQQKAEASSYPSWHIQPQTTIDRSYFVASPVNIKTAAVQEDPVQSPSSQLQSQQHADTSYANPAYTKSDVLQQPAAATSTFGWQLQHTPIDRSYFVLNPAYANSAVLQPDAIPQTKWQLPTQQLQMPVDRAYTSVNSGRYYPYSTLRQSTLVKPYIDKSNQKYKQYNLSHQPSHLYGSFPIHSPHFHPHGNYYTRQSAIQRENPPFFKPYPTKYVNFTPNHFPMPYNGLLNFSRHRPTYKGSPFSSDSSGSMYYKILFPLALLGISIPALGMMYTYLSKRRRRRSADDLLPSVDDIEYYMQMLQKAVETFEENDDTTHAKH